jgi:hypothetical protein
MIARRLATACILAGTLAVPATAAAMPVDNGPPPVAHDTSDQAPAPVVRTIVRSTDDTLPIAVAGVALLVAMTSAGYSAVRLAPLRTARSQS